MAKLTDPEITDALGKGFKIRRKNGIAGQTFALEDTSLVLLCLNEYNRSVPPDLNIYDLKAEDWESTKEKY